MFLFLFGVLLIIVLHVMIKNRLGIYHDPTVRGQSNLYVHALAFFGHLFKIVHALFHAGAV